MHGIGMGNFLLDKDGPITFVILITILQTLTNSIMLCHDRFVKFKTNIYYNKSDEIHSGLVAR